MIKNIYSNRNRNLLSQMIKTDFKLRYQGSALGYLWSLLRPLLLFAILYVVFTRFMHIGRGVPNYALSLLLGIVLWSFFIEATSSALRSIVGRGSLIRKIRIPRYLIPMSVVASAFINLLISIVVVLAFVLFTDSSALSLKSMIVFPLLILELTVVSLSVGFLLSALFVYYRDIEHIWEILKQALFYLIPIIYPLTLIPYVNIQKILILNPLAQIIQDSRAVLTYSKTTTIHSLYGNFIYYLVPIGVIALSIVVSTLYFKKKSKYFAEEI